MRTYRVNVNFASYIGADEEYFVDAENDDSATVDALELAKEDLTIEDLNQIGDDEWEAEVGFAGYIGATQMYTVYGGTEDEAWDAAIEEGYNDLSAEIVSVEDQNKNRLESVLGLDNMTDAEVEAIKDDWKAFYNDPEKFEGSAVVEMVLSYLEDRK